MLWLLPRYLFIALIVMFMLLPAYLPNWRGAVAAALAWPALMVTLLGVVLGVRK